MDIWGLWEKLQLPAEIILTKLGARVTTLWAPRLPWGICLGVENGVCGCLLPLDLCGTGGFPHPSSPRSQVCSASLPAMGLQGLDRHCSLSALPTKAEP